MANREPLRCSTAVRGIGVVSATNDIGLWELCNP